MVEIAELQSSKLNFMIGGPVIRKSFDISREQLDHAIQNFFKASLQIGKVAFRVTYLRTEIPVFRKQLHKRLLVIYPYKAKLPFEESDLQLEEMTASLELPLLNVQLAIHD